MAATWWVAKDMIQGKFKAKAVDITGKTITGPSQAGIGFATALALDGSPSSTGPLGNPEKATADAEAIAAQAPDHARPESETTDFPMRHGKKRGRGVERERDRKKERKKKRKKERKEKRKITKEK